jgi:hypothetical protein
MFLGALAGTLLLLEVSDASSMATALFALCLITAISAVLFRSEMHWARAS